MMWKLIFIGIFIWLAIQIFKRATSQSDASRTQKQDHAGSTTQAKDAAHTEDTENMVQCATCAVHLPRSEAFLVNSHFYCCQAHIKHQ